MEIWVHLFISIHCLFITDSIKVFITIEFVTIFEGGKWDIFQSLLMKDEEVILFLKGFDQMFKVIFSQKMLVIIMINYLY